MKELGAADWIDVTKRCIKTGFSIRKGFGSIGSASDVSKLTITYRSDDLASAAIFHSSAKQIRIEKDGVAAFEGYTEGSASVESTALPSLAWVKLSAYPYAKRFEDVDAPSDLVYEGKKICDPSDKANSLLHLIINALYENLDEPYKTICGAIPSASRVLTDVTINKVLPFAVVEKDDSILDALDTLLKEYGLARYMEGLQLVVVEPYAENDGRPTRKLKYTDIEVSPTIKTAPYILEQKTAVKLSKVRMYEKETVYALYEPDKDGKVDSPDIEDKILAGNVYPLDGDLEADYETERETDTLELFYATGLSYEQDCNYADNSGATALNFTKAELGGTSALFRARNDTGKDVYLRQLRIEAAKVYYRDTSVRIEDTGISSSKKLNEIASIYMVDDDDAKKYIRTYRAELLAEKTSYSLQTGKVSSIEPNSLITIGDIPSVILVRYIEQDLSTDEIKIEGVQFSIVPVSATSFVRKNSATGGISYLSLTLDGTAYTYDGEGNLSPADQSITATVRRFGTVEPPRWYINGILQESNNDITLRVPATFMQGRSFITVRVEVGSLYSEQYVYKLSNGTDGKDGIPGKQGWSTATPQLYKKADSLPDRFDGGSLTYTFSTASLSGDFGSWSRTIPSGEGDVYTCIASVASQSDTYTITPTKWSAPAKLAAEGNDGQPGLNVANIQLFRRSTSKPDRPTETVSYNFETRLISNTGVWSPSVPSGTLPVWTTIAIASSRSNSDVIEPDEWADPAILAQNGTDGKDGSDGVGIKSITRYYAVSSSNITVPTSWSSTEIPKMTAEQKYLWSYEKITYTNDSFITTEKLIIGVYGDKGNTGNEGTGIESITNYYLASASPTGITISTSGWTETVQTITSTKKYLWNYEKIVYTDSTFSTTPPCIIGTYGEKGDKGDTGARGPQGEQGDKGEQGDTGNGISSVTEYYAVSSNNTTAPTSFSQTVPSMTATLKYLWNYERIAYTDGTSKDTSKRVIGVYGDKGEQGIPGNDGADGVGIESIVVYYLAYASASGVTVNTSGWTTTIQTITSSKKYLWTYERYNYSDGTYTNTTPCVKGVYGNTGATGSDGKPAISFSISASNVSYVMSSRSVVLEEQNITLSCIKQNTTGTATWSLTGDEGITLSATTGDTVTVRIAADTKTTSFIVTCSVSGVGTQTLRIIGIASGIPHPVYLGTVTYPDPKPTKTEEGDLMIGDHILYVYQHEGRTEQVVQFWSGSTWADVTKSTANYSEIMSNILGDALSNPATIPSTSALYAYFGNLVAKAAFLEQLYSEAIRVGKSLSAGAYDENGNNQSGGAGVYLDKNGVFKAVEAYLRRAIIEGSLNCFDEAGTILKTQYGNDSGTTLSASAKSRWSSKDLCSAIGLGSSGSCTYKGTNYYYKRINNSNPFDFIKRDMGVGREESKLYTFTAPFAFTLYLTIPQYSQGFGRLFFNVTYRDKVYEYKGNGTIIETFFLEEGESITVEGSSESTYGTVVFSIRDDCVVLYNQSTQTGTEEYNVLNCILENDNLFYSYTFVSSVFNSSSNIKYAAITGWITGLTAGKGYTLASSSSIVVNGITKKPVSISYSGNEITFLYNDGSSDSFSCPTDTAEGASKGWYNISGSYTIASETRGVLTHNLIPVDGSRSIGENGNRYNFGWFNNLAGNLTGNVNAEGTSNRVWGAVAN